MLRVGLDTNVFVSSLLVKTGMPARVVDAWRAERYALLVTPVMIEELQHTLGYERIRRRYEITDEKVNGLVQLLHNKAIIVEGEADVAGVIPADPSDEAILACGVDGRADLIVSGDRHLLDLGEFWGIPVVPVQAFVEWLDSGA